MVLEDDEVGEEDSLAASAKAARAENEPGVEMVYARDITVCCWLALDNPLEPLALEHGGLNSECDGEEGWWKPFNMPGGELARRSDTCCPCCEGLSAADRIRPEV